MERQKYNFSRTDKLIKRMLDNGDAIGISAHVIRQDELIYECLAGYADKDNQKPMTSDTIFRIYSMTKPVTMVVLLKLYEEGLFRLDDPVSSWLPGFTDTSVKGTDENGHRSHPVRSRPVTIRHLMTMTSGLPYHWDDSDTGQQIASMFKTLENQAAMSRSTEKINTVSIANSLGQIPLVFQPGDHWQYGLSHDVLGAVIEVMTGMKLSDAMRTMIFEPLGMNDTAFWLTSEQQPRLSALYALSGDGSLKANTAGLINWDPGKPPLFEQGGAGLFSTLGDYVRFARMLLGGGQLEGVRIIGRKTLALMTAGHLSKQQRKDFLLNTGMIGYSYGLGVRTLVEPAASGSNGSVGEFGWEGAAGSWFGVDPSEEMAIVYMIQRLPGNHRMLIPPLLASIYSSI